MFENIHGAAQCAALKAGVKSLSLALCLGLGAFSPARAANPEDIKVFEVPLGSTINGFTYSKAGALLCDGKPFAPPVTASPQLVPKFTLSLLRPARFAAAISEDIDGQSRLFVLNLNDASSATPSPSWVAARQIFWSPDRRYMLALCSYEGQRFIGFDLGTRKFLQASLAPPQRKGRCWTVIGRPEWVDDGHIEFNVKEDWDPYGTDRAGGNEPDKTPSMHRIWMNAGTLKMAAMESSGRK